MPSHLKTFKKIPIVWDSHQAFDSHPHCICYYVVDPVWINNKIPVFTPVYPLKQMYTWPELEDFLSSTYNSMFWRRNLETEKWNDITFLTNQDCNDKYNDINLLKQGLLKIFKIQTKNIWISFSLQKNSERFKISS